MNKNLETSIAYWQIANSHYGVNPIHKDHNGTKTVVKCNPGDVFDPEKGLAMACTKKLFGNNGFYYDIFRKWLPEEESGLLVPKEMLDVIGKIAIGATIHDKYKNQLKEAMVREKAKFEGIPSVFKNFATLIDKEEGK